MSLSIWGEAFAELMHADIMLALMVGVLAGTFIGALPALSGTMGVAIMTPLTFWLSKECGFAMLIGLYNAACFAGGVSAVLINTPGTPSSVTQCFDGYPLYLKGKGGLALGINAIFSFIGSIVSIFFLAVLAEPIARFTVSFGPAEYFMISLFGIVMMIAVAEGKVLKGFIMGALGILLSCVGLDPILGMPRFTFGNTSLLAGIDFIPVIVGIFGLGEVLYQTLIRDVRLEKESQEKRHMNMKLGSVWPSREQMCKWTPMALVTACVSTVIGAIPAAGGDISTIICWGNAKKLSKHPEEYGKGSLEGFMVSSTANNGVVGGAMMTMLTLGLPGDSVTAVLIGSLMMYGLQPGWAMFNEHQVFTAQIILLMALASVGFLIVGLATAKICSKFFNVSQPTIWACIVILCIVGSFALNGRFGDVVIMLVMGVLGLFMKYFDFPAGPLVLGLLLGKTLESNMRKALSISGGDYSYFFRRPVSCVIFALIIATFIFPFMKKYVGCIKQKKIDEQNR